MIETPLNSQSRANAIRVESAVDGAEWNAFVEGHRLATVDHLWQWRNILEDAFGYETEYLVARRGSTLEGILPLALLRSRVFGRRIISLPALNYGGLLVRDPRAVQPLVDSAVGLAERFRASYIELRHQVRTTDLPERQHRVMMRLPLPKTTEAMWQSLDRKVRNQVRKAQGCDLDLHGGGEALLQEFYDVFAHNMRDLGTPVYPKRLFTNVLRAFRERARIWVVKHRGRAVAGGLTLRLNDTVLVPSASSLKSHRQLCPNMLLYFGMIEDAVKSGARVFDFGRSSPDAGTVHFKKQWGASAEPMHWEYALLGQHTLPDRDRISPVFRAGIAVWKHLPVRVATALGPVVVRNLP
jgi:FemAB-related protein (PEP-CTERM system-associated)